MSKHSDVSDAGSEDLTIAGENFTPDLSGALWHAASRTLIVADLHLEKGSSYAARGAFLPPYDTAATLALLAVAIARHRPACVVALGDSFHDRGGHARLAAADLAALGALQAGRDWIWIAGNHDPLPPLGLGGDAAQSHAIGAVMLRHEPSVRCGGAEIAGHLHPVAKVRLRGRAQRRRAFVSDGRRCVLPAFGAYAGGLNLLDSAVSGLFPDGFAAHVMGQGRLFRIGPACLTPDG